MRELYGKRILIIGSSGSGKTTLSLELAKITGLPLIHLDQHYWKPGWQSTPKEEWRPKVATLCAGESWIMDGNFGSTMDLRMERADTIIFLDFPRTVCIMGYLKRLLTNWGKSRSEMPEGCKESLDIEFMRFIWNFPKVSGQGIREKLNLQQGKIIHVLKSRRQVKDFLRKLTDTTA